LVPALERDINDMGGLHLQENVLKFSAGWENYDL